MTVPIDESLQTTRAALRRVAMLRGIALVVAMLAGAVIAIGCLDWAIHLDDQNTRIAFAIATASAGVAAFIWWVVLPATTRLSDFQIARRIELACPELAGRLSSSVEFLAKASDGSSQLQQHTVERTVKQLGGLPLEQLVDRSALRITGCMAIFIVSAGAALFATSPVDASIAIRRLILPLRSNPWPRTTDLRVIDENGTTLPRNTALTVVRGETFELLAENTRGQLPDDCVVEHRLGAQGKSRYEPLQPITLEAEITGEAGRAVISPAKGPTYLRVIGGDHWSPWYRLNVVSPPTLRDLKLEIVPPGYLGREPEIVSAESSVPDAVVGSRLRITATTSKPVQSASVAFQDQTERADVDGQQREIRCELDLDKEGTYSWSIELTDTNGIEDPRPTQYELRVVRDTPPDVFIDQPREDVQVTAVAMLPIRAVAKDDQAVVSLRLEIVNEDGTAETAATATASPAGDAATGQANFAFDLTKHQARPGQKFLLRAIAADAYDVDGETREVVSDVRTVTVVSSEAKNAELAQRQAELLDAIKRASEAQSKAFDNVGELEIQQRTTGLLRRADLDLLKATELAQQRISNSLFDEELGLRERLRALVAEFDQNQLGPGEARSQLDAILGELNDIHDHVSAPLELQLSMTRKDVEEALTESGSPDGAAVPGVGSALKNVQQLQAEIVDSLQSLVAGAAAWRRRVDLLSAVTEIAVRQDALIRDTNRLTESMLAGTAEADRRQIKADGTRLAQRQERLAGSFEQLLEETPADQRSGTNERTAKSMLELAMAASPNLKMREAASELSAQRAAAAARLQGEAAMALADLIAALNQPNRETDAELGGVSELAKALQSLVREETKLKRQLDSGSDPREIASPQAGLRRRAERRHRQLVRQEIPEAATAIEGAAMTMRSAETQLTEENRAAATRTMTAVVDKLGQALKAVQEHQRQLQTDATRAQLQNAVATVRDLAARQQNITAQTSHFEALLQQTGRRTRRDSRDVLNLGKREQALADEVEGLRDQLMQVEIVPLLLESIREQMRESERRLSQRLTDEETVRLQRSAARELLAIAESLQKPNPGLEATPAQPAGASGTSDSKTSPGPLLVRLKLIRALQRSVASATERLVSHSTPEQRDRVAKRQRDVARLTTELLQALKSAGKE